MTLPSPTVVKTAEVQPNSLYPSYACRSLSDSFMNFFVETLYFGRYFGKFLAKVTEMSARLIQVTTVVKTAEVQPDTLLFSPSAQGVFVGRNKKEAHFFMETKSPF